MWWIAALLACILTSWSCLRAVRSVRRRPLGLDAVLAYAVLVSAEAIVVHALSAVHALGRPGLLLGNLIVAITAWWAARRQGTRPRWRSLLPYRHPVTVGVLALAAMALVSALAYRPNNWDSMTYHLARVAHWLQQGSVARFVTGNERQVLLPPGAEYLLVVLQGIAGTDRLAGLVQWAAWIATAMAAIPLARLFGAPRWLAPFAVALVAAGPLAVQEASSTQNDLVAGACAVALVAAVLPFLHRRARWRPSDLGILILAACSALVVKPTSVVVATPFLLWGGACSLRRLPDRGTWERIGRAAPAILVAAGVVVPYQYQWAAAAQRHQVIDAYVYRGFEDGRDRATNVMRGVFRNIPLPIAALDALAPAHTEGCDRPASLCLQSNRLLTEDFTSSVGQAIIVLACIVVSAARWRSLPGRARSALVSVLGAWCLFQLTFRDNVWIPRLHLAFFAVSALSLAAFAGVRVRRGRLLSVAVVAVALFGVAAVAAVRTPRRPLMTRPLRMAGSVADYYREGPAGVAEEQQGVLAWLAKSGCRRLGLYLGGDSYDYPVTWRAMMLGVQVRHVVGPGRWPCAVYSDRGAPPNGYRALNEGGSPFLWVPSAGARESPHDDEPSR